MFYGWTHRAKKTLQGPGRAIEVRAKERFPPRNQRNNGPGRRLYPHAQCPKLCGGLDAASRPLKEQILRRISVRPDRTPSHSLHRRRDERSRSPASMALTSKGVECPPDDERLIEWLKSAPWSLTLAVLGTSETRRTRTLQRTLRRFRAERTNPGPASPRDFTRNSVPPGPEKESRWPQ